MFRQSLRSRSRSRPNEEESEDSGPPAPLPTDVIVGRGKGAYLSDGNRRFTQTIRSFLPVYNQTKTTQEKVQVTNNIVDHIKSNGGRFLRIDNKGKLHPVPDKEARIKVAQAIRHQRRLIEEGKTSEASSSTGLTSDTTGLVPNPSGPSRNSRRTGGAPRSSRARAAAEVSRRGRSARDRVEAAASQQRSQRSSSARAVAATAAAAETSYAVEAAISTDAPPQEAAVAAALASLAQQQQPLVGTMDMGRPPVWNASNTPAGIPQAASNNNAVSQQGQNYPLSESMGNMQIDFLGGEAGGTLGPPFGATNNPQVMLTFPEGNLDNFLASSSAEHPSNPNLTGRDADIDEVVSGNFSFNSLEERNVASM